jgi:hypothetical protein
VPDSTLSAIDRVFDLVDSVVDKTDRVLNRSKYTEEQHHARRARKPEKIDTAPSVKVAKTTAIAKRQFRIIEATDATSGQQSFVVTNDSGTARAECSSREMAEKILRALEMAP